MANEGVIPSIGNIKLVKQLEFPPSSALHIGLIDLATPFFFPVEVTKVKFSPGFFWTWWFWNSWGFSVEVDRICLLNNLCTWLIYRWLLVNFLVVKTELEGWQPEDKEKQAIKLELTSFSLGFPALLFLPHFFLIILLPHHFSLWQPKFYVWKEFLKCINNKILYPCGSI